MKISYRRLVSTSKCILHHKKEHPVYKIVFIIHLSLFLILNVLHLDAKVDTGSTFTLILLSILESILFQLILRLFLNHTTTEDELHSSGNEMEDMD